MIRISKLADYAVVVLGALAQGDAGHVNASGLSARTGLPEPTVAKVLKMLAREGIVESIRGAQGGYRLTAEPSDLRVSRIIEAVEGPIAITECEDGSSAGCGYQRSCAMRGRWRGVNDAIRAALENVSLADMGGQAGA